MQQMRQFYAAWLTTNRTCNFRCTWCYAENAGYDAKSSMTKTMAIELLNIFKQLRIPRVLFIGGESILWQYYNEAIQECNKLGLIKILVTNGYAFSIDSYWNNYLENPCDAVGVSIKAGNKTQLEQLAGVTRYGRLLIGLKRILNHHPNSGATITYNKYYAKNLPEVVQLAVDCGAKNVKIDFCLPAMKDGKPDHTNLMEFRQVVSDTVKFYDQLEAITQGHLSFEVSSPLCIWPRDFIEMLEQKGQIITVCHLRQKTGLIINTNGDLIVCNGLFDYPLGRYDVDFKDSVSLMQFLNNETNTKYYNQLLAYPSEECQNCSWYQKCGGGCVLNWSIYDPKSYIKAIH